MEIRLAKLEDVDTLVSFRKQQLIDEGDDPSVNINKELKDYFTGLFSDDKSIIWMVTDNGMPVATGGLYFFQYPPGYRNPTGIRAYIHSLYTVNQYRRQGIATKLINLMIAEVKSRGCKVLFLLSSKDGGSVYEKIGFTKPNDYMVMRF